MLRDGRHHRKGAASREGPRVGEEEAAATGSASAGAPPPDPPLHRYASEGGRESEGNTSSTPAATSQGTRRSPLCPPRRREGEPHGALQVGLARYIGRGRAVLQQIQGLAWAHGV